MKRDDPTTTSEHSGASGTPLAVWVGIGFLAVLSGTIAGLPLLAGAISVSHAGELTRGPQSGAELLLTTAAVSGLIATGATLLGLPGAFLLARAGLGGRGKRWIAALVASVMFLPAYFPYAGYSAARAPTTLVGNLMSHWSPDAIVMAGRVLAVVGLMIAWWPLSALMLAEGLKRTPAGMPDAMAMDGATRSRVMLTRLGLARGWLLAAWGLVFVYGLGSAIPLHLSQIQTFTIALWKGLDSSPSPGGTIAASWPLVLIAAITSWVFSRRGGFDQTEEISAGTPEAAGRWNTFAVVLIWAISVPIPLLVLAASIKESSPALLWARAVLLFHENTNAVRGSLVTGLVVAIGSCLLAALTAFACSTGAAGWRATRLILAVFITLALVPGVIVGCCVRLGWDMLGPAADSLTSSPVVVALAHLARFGFIGVAAGRALAAAEPAEQRAMRVLDGATGLWGWMRTVLPQAAIGITSATLCGFALSIGEIECTVILQPPGSESVARLMLERLHFLKDQDLAAAGVTIAAVTVSIGIIVSFLIGAGQNRRRARSREG